MNSAENKSSIPGSGKNGSDRAAAEQARHRRWFRVLALLSPLVLLVLAEFVLRLIGSGYDTSFFVWETIAGQPHWVENRKFSWRFFPPRLARTPQPLALRTTKPAGMLRVFVLGESAAMGDPEPAFGFARQLEVMLQARHPDKTVSVINTGMTAINSHVIREIAPACAARAGDCWIVYAGNNEVIGPFGAGTVFGRQAPPLAFVRLAVWLKQSRLVQSLGFLSRPPHLPDRWEGMELFLGQQVPASDPRLPRVYENFRANLGAIIRQGQSSGAKVLVATVPVNLKDCPPFGSAHRAGLSRQQLEAWDRHFAAGKDAEQRGRWADALRAYEDAAQIDSEYAELLFRRAAAEAATGNASAARKDFSRARDLDTLRFRADTRLNEIIRQVTGAASAELLDAEHKLAATEDDVPGDELFYDHVHLNFHGNYLLARLFLAQVERQVFGAADRSATVTLQEEEVARRLAFTALERRRISQEMRLRMQQPPFLTQSNYRARDERWRGIIEGLNAEPRDCLPEFAAALARRGDDWVLHANYARALAVAGYAGAAGEQWQTVARLIPHSPEPWFQLGSLAMDRRDFTEAERLFREVLRRDPFSTEALSGLGLAVSGQGRNAEARKHYRKALEVDPRCAAARLNLAVLIAKAGDNARAAAEYRTLLALETNNVAARINLARLLAAENRPTEAIQLLREAVILKPDEPFARFDLANALAAGRQYPDAISNYYAAIKARPDFAEAHYNLALELSRAGSINEALPQFAEAIRLKPDVADAHFNYGIALAKQKAYAAAVIQFRETLRLQPQHSEAQLALQRALTLERQSPGASR